MTEPVVWTFFYGSYMNLDVLRDTGLVPQEWEVAQLGGFDLRIAPRANLVASNVGWVFGIVATATHPELERLYAHARDVLREIYVPHPVLVTARSGRWRPALCYIAPAMEPRPAERDYVERILRPARELGFPWWYVRQIEGFIPQ